MILTGGCMLQELFEDFKREKTYINGVAKKPLTWYWCSFEAYKRVLNGNGDTLPTKHIPFWMPVTLSLGRRCALFQETKSGLNPHRDCTSIRG
jgi:hypothetical protein